MNIKVLNELMKLNSITSYFHLSKEIDIPYTTLLDLVNGKGEKLTNIKIIANYFHVSIGTLVDNEKIYITIDENNNITEKIKTDYNSYETFLIS